VSVTPYGHGNLGDRGREIPPIVSDNEGLRWATRRRRTLVIIDEPERRPSLELICLDDSALKKEIAFQDDDAVNGYLSTEAVERLLRLIELVKETYTDLEKPGP
jgi:hypothetical protein